MLKKLSLRLIAAAVLLGAAQLAKAGNTDALETTSCSIPLTLTNWTGTLAIPQFDPSLGTLKSIEVCLSGSFETTLTIQNYATSDSSGKALTEVLLSVADAGNYLNNSSLDLENTPAYTYSHLAPGAGITTPDMVAAGTSDETYSTQALLNEFTGNGNVMLSASTATYTTQFNNGGNTDVTQVTWAAVTGDVTYNFEPIPEPGTLILSGIGAAGLFFFARRKAASREKMVVGRVEQSVA